jgi:Spy/CpxP family protein refolding chaperone
MKKFVIALMVTATSAIGFAQTAGHGTFHKQGMHRGGFGHIAATLNLTDAQKQQMKDIRTAARESNKQLYADFRAKLQELRALKEANDPKAAGVKSQLEAMRPQVQAARKATHGAMLNILTPEQRDQLKSARQSSKFGMGRARGAMRGMRGDIASHLNLTDAQKAELKQLRQTTHDQNAQLFADAKAKRQQLRSLSSDDPQASELKAQLQALRPQLEAARKQQHEAFLNVLTAEQRAQLDQWKAQRQTNRRQGR